METKSLDELLAEYQEILGPETGEAKEMVRFREFLVQHGGLRKVQIPGKSPRLLDRADALRCFHFSQYLEWFLAEKVAVPRKAVEASRVAMNRFNEWLLERQAISADAFEENQESILGGEVASSSRHAAREGDEESEEGLSSLREEKDFYVPGEYSQTLSGEFVLTKVQEGILFGRRDEDPDEIGPILVDRAVSSGSRVGDRVHLSLGRAGSHWNLLTLGRPRSS
jgi:hypothetical protein